MTTGKVWQVIREVSTDKLEQTLVYFVRSKILESYKNGQKAAKSPWVKKVMKK